MAKASSIRQASPDEILCASVINAVREYDATGDHCHGGRKGTMTVHHNSDCIRCNLLLSVHPYVRDAYLAERVVATWPRPPSLKNV